MPTTILGSSVSSNYDMEYKFTCGKYQLYANPFVATDKTLDKMSRYARGNVGVTSIIWELRLNIRQLAKESHMVPGIQHNLLSTAKFIDTDYAWLFDDNEVQVFDKSQTKITTTRAAVMKG